MTKTIEVVFEDKVLKPLQPLEGMRDHETAWVMIRSHPRKSELQRLFGTLDEAEAKEMSETIGREFEKIEGQW